MKTIVNERPRDDEGKLLKRPCAELVDASSLELVATVYGSSHEELMARVRVVQLALDHRVMSKLVREQLRRVAKYEWLYYKSKKRPLSIFTLLFWLVGIDVEPWVTAHWLSANFPPLHAQGSISGNGHLRERLEAYR